MAELWRTSGMGEKPLRFGLIGCGRVARYHARALERLGDEESSTVGILRSCMLLHIVEWHQETAERAGGSIGSARC